MATLKEIPIAQFVEDMKGILDNDDPKGTMCAFSEDPTEYFGEKYKVQKTSVKSRLTPERTVYKITKN